MDTYRITIEFKAADHGQARIAAHKAAAEVKSADVMSTKVTLSYMPAEWQQVAL